MQNRIDELRRRLEEIGAGAYVSFSPPANRYLTGFRGSTSAVVITPDEAVFLCDFRYTEQAGRQVRGCDVREMRGSLELRAAELLANAGIGTVAFDPAVMSVHQMSTLQKAYAGTMTPAADLVAGLRMKKDPEEIAAIRTASQRTEAALEIMLAELRPGITEREAAARLEYEFRLQGADGAAFDTIVLFGARSSEPHGMPGDKALEPGDIVLIDCGCQREGYCADLTRTYVYGTIPSNWFEEIYHVTLTAQEAAVAAVKPGARTQDIDAMARSIIRDAGYGERFGHGLGHGVGLEVHELPRLNMESETVLEEGMVVTVEPGIYLPGQGGVRIEDLVVVTQTGCAVLTQLSKQLKVLSA